MRVALIKQVLDVSGPWSGMLWEHTDARSHLDKWPGRPMNWELTCLLKADWYIVPQILDTDYTYDAVYKHNGQAEMVRQHSGNISMLENVPFDKYDIIITLDPFLDVPEGSQVVFAYYIQEHWDKLYRLSQKKVIGNYDLFLDHMLIAENSLRLLPQGVAFPYLRYPEIMRSVFSVEKQETAWVDWRTLTALTGINVWSNVAEEAARYLEKSIKLPVYSKGFVTSNSPYGISNPPAFGDPVKYLAALATCKYYISVGRHSGAGQGVSEAASIGCLCFGEQDKVYHRLVCHPFCLCAGLAELSQKVQQVIASPDLQIEILAWQDRALQEHFVIKPLKILEKAVKMKKLQGSPIRTTLHHFAIQRDTSNTLYRKLLRFLSKPTIEKREILQRVVIQKYSRINLVFPVRLPFGMWMFTWPDVMGRNMRQGNFEENERLFVVNALKPGSVVLDVGANIGFYTLLFSQIVGNQGTVIAFEPSLRERQRLKWNVKLNRRQNIKVEPYALGNADGLAELFVVRNKETGCNSMRPPKVNEPTDKVTIAMTSLDRYLAHNHLYSVDFIKVDIEGAEYEFMQGAKTVLESGIRPIILFEAIDFRTIPWGYKIQEIYDFLSLRQYQLFSLVKGGYLFPCPRKDKFHENLVAVPEDRLHEIERLIL